MASILCCCVRIVRWIPVVFISLVVVWSYYAYVVSLNYNTLIVSKGRVAEAVIYLILYHGFLFMFLWAYIKVTITDPAEPPREFFLTESESYDLATARLESSEKVNAVLQTVAKRLPVDCRTVHRASPDMMEIRFCEKCEAVKPDRAHHCSMCGTCVLKMDHHCPWVNNCVNFSNYKFFILFLFYAETYCLYVAATTAQYFIGIWQRGTNLDFHVMFVFIVAIMFALSVLGLLGYHIYLTLRNQSTLESFRQPIFNHTGPDGRGYDLGKKRNFQEVFGDNKLTMFLPIFTAKGDGVRYRRTLQNGGGGPTYNTLSSVEGGLPRGQQVDHSTIWMNGDHGENKPDNAGGFGEDVQKILPQ